MQHARPPGRTQNTHTYASHKMARARRAALLPLAHFPAGRGSEAASLTPETACGPCSLSVHCLPGVWAAAGRAAVTAAAMPLSPPLNAASCLLMLLADAIAAGAPPGQRPHSCVANDTSVLSDSLSATCRGQPRDILRRLLKTRPILQSEGLSGRTYHHATGCRAHTYFHYHNQLPRHYPPLTTPR